MIQHTNRKGDTYFLHAGAREDGKVHYYFSTKVDESRVADRMPKGREIYEKPQTAQVFLRPSVKSEIRDEELALAKRIIAECCELPEYATTIERNRNEILIHEVAGCTDLLDDDSGSSAKATSPQELLAKLAEVETIADPIEKLEQFAALQQDYLMATFRSPEARRNRAVRGEFWPVLRCELESGEGAERLFATYRFHHSLNDWVLLGTGSLEDGLRETVPHLGKESFFELGC